MKSGTCISVQERDEILPASSLLKHIGGLILKTFPCSPPFPTRMPSSTIHMKVNSYTTYLEHILERTDLYA